MLPNWILSLSGQTTVCTHRTGCYLLWVPLQTHLEHLKGDECLNKNHFLLPQVCVFEDREPPSVKLLWLMFQNSQSAFQLIWTTLYILARSIPRQPCDLWGYLPAHCVTLMGRFLNEPRWLPLHTAIGVWENNSTLTQTHTNTDQSQHMLEMTSGLNIHLFWLITTTAMI